MSREASLMKEANADLIDHFSSRTFIGYIPLSNAEGADEEEEEEEEGEEEEEEEEQVGDEEDDGHDLLVGAMSVPSVSMVDGEEDVVDDFVVSYNALPQKDYLVSWLAAAVGR